MRNRLLLHIALLGALMLGTMSPSFAQTPPPNLQVRITEKIHYLDVIHNGQTVRIQRIQDQGNRLIDDYTRTSRPCPPFCLQPNQLAPKVETFAELEMIEFIAGPGKSNAGLLIDTRLPEFYKADTIPTAINVPFTVLNNENPHLDRILTAVGGTKNAAGKWDFQKAKTLALFCNGAYCDSTPRAIQRLLGLGYAPEKLKYYRGGMQTWRLQGLTTVTTDKPIH
jgi:rhodanese-related sulfurtransferase